ncbi:NADH-FMN oxidoreductase RutF, flavin reductase (DIM6/NTAB) family [Kaistia soli DSM 19436]|uniref:NADH-FMN oxidoreductase RutF, flavin reductase (DIM6/NTAB) family n=1 Tax=Kaistia soli DSM 19436 TaxID=1122133 RepID=A0A1M4X5K8_9HYPH|nr:flavin reductase family protein [Kaistia soli]SHE88798.1 NADH-FMN oxidoreductase RutF, flavin reductase (DIM6/NTAB) family [Kaistia soli DSM 19436]
MSLAEAIDGPDRLDGERFKHAMRHLAGAVSVITAGTGPERTGFTATSVSSLSADSPSIIVSLNRASSSWPVLRRAGRFAVNILAEDQQPIAEAFAGRGGLKGADRYRDAQWFSFASGSLGLSGALVSIDCVLEEAIERHSHAILIGAVHEVVLTAEAQPLLYWHGAYRRISNLTGED